MKYIMVRRRDSSVFHRDFLGIYRDIDCDVFVLDLLHFVDMILFNYIGILSLSASCRGCLSVIFSLTSLGLLSNSR